MATLSSPSFAIQNTTYSNDLSADGYTWANTTPVIVDQYGKLTVWAQRYNSGSRSNGPIVSNDNGATWSDPTRTSFFNSDGEGALVRGAVAYDSINDLMHVLWTDENSLVLYRRYSYTRDGSHNITGVTRVSGVNLVMDPGSGSFAFGFPTILFASEGTNGTLVCGWVASNAGGSPNKTEVRLSMRVLSNTTADNTSSNWAAPGGTPATASNGITAVVPFTAVHTSAGSGVGAMAIYRKQAGTNLKDLYVAWFDSHTSVATSTFEFARLRWNSGAGDWSTGQTSTQVLSLVQVAGTDTGYSLKAQLLSKWAEDTANDRLYIAFPVWLDDTNGDTVSFKTVNAASSDALSSRIDVYSAAGTHSFAPTGDIMYDNTAALLVYSYIKTSTQFVYIKTYANTTISQAETLLFNADTVDIPLLMDVRVNGKLASIFRESTGSVPFTGYFGTMTWTGAAAALAAAVATAGTTVGALTTAIQFAGSVATSALIAAAFSTAIRLASAVNTAVTILAGLFTASIGPLTSQTPVVAGLAVTYTAANGSGDTFVNRGKDFLHVKNGSGSSVTVTVACANPCSFGVTHAAHNLITVVGAGADRLIGPFDKSQYNDSSNLVTVTYSSATSVTVALLASA